MRSLATDVVDGALNGHALEGAERQGEKQADTAVEDDEGVVEGARVPWDVPVTAAGSGIPQCAVMGWPGQTGQTSRAALSQTVKTKCMGGAPGAENSSQDLLRRPAVGMPESSSWRRASGRTLPEG